MALVLSHLLDGDELGQLRDVNGKPLGALVPPSHDLAALYRTTARAIVEANGVRFRTADIDAWVMDTGGKRLSNGQPVFAATSRILLPAGGARSPVTSTGPSTGAVAAGGGGLLLLAGVAAWFFLK